MKSLAQKYDESRLSARFAMLMGLLMSGEWDGLLSMESLRTSSLAVSYAVALAALGLSTLTFLIRKGRDYLSPEELLPAPKTAPVWHQARLFTDPWYQIPAIYCAFVLVVRLVMELVQAPPLSDRTVWYLVFVALMSVVLPASISKRVKLEQADQNGTPEGRDSHPTIAGAFRDPWFTVPAAALAAVHLARYGVETIEEDPASTRATVLFLAPLAAMAVAAVMPSIDRLWRLRRRDKASKSADLPAPGVTSELLSSKPRSD